MQDDNPPFPSSLEARYKQPRFISAGGAGAVYAALDNNLNKQVAIKILNVNSGDQKLLRFQQEAKAIAKFNHANIVTALDFGLVDEKIAYLVLDLVGDASLNSLIQRREKLSIQKSLNIFRQICVGMAYAHAQGVLHRDLKPSNVLLENSSSEHPIAKVADFGIAKISGTPVFATTGNIYIGTPAYTSPEQFLGDDVDERSDIYSFGCLMFATLEGDTPFVGETTTELALKHANDPVPEIERTYSGEEIPVLLQTIVETCLEKDPEDRYGNFLEVADLIEQVQREFIDSPAPVQQRSGGSTMKSQAISSSNPYRDSASSPPFRLSDNRSSKIIIVMGVLVVIIGLLICKNLGVDVHLFFKDSSTTSGGTTHSKVRPLPHIISDMTDYDYRRRQPKLPESELTKPIPTLIEIAESKIAEKDYYLANSYLDFILDRKPDNIKALKLRSESRRKVEYFKGAIVDISDALQLEPDNKKLLIKRAQLRKDMGDLKGAIADYSTYLIANPTSAKNFKEHAKLCEKLDMGKEALKSYTRAIDLEPEDASSFIGRGRLLQTLGERQKAVGDFSKAIALNPNDPEIYNARGNSFMSLHQYQKAVDDYSKAIELDTNNTGIYHRVRGDAYALLGKKALADRDYLHSRIESIEPLPSSLTESRKPQSDDR